MGTLGLVAACIFVICFDGPGHSYRSFTNFSIVCEKTRAVNSSYAMAWWYNPQCKEERLGLLACAVDSGCDSNACKLGATLHFEFYTENDSTSSHGETNTSGLRVIHIPDLHLRLEEDNELLKKLVDQYQVPSNLRFALLTRIRFARAFANLNSRRQHIRIRLLAFTVLLQSNQEKWLFPPF